MDPEGTKWFRAGIVARARFIEDVVTEQANRGVAQYVILGAGLDTFAQRRPEIASRLRVFEVDQPGPQAWKRRRLDELGLGVPEWLRLVPVDFEGGGSWWEQLVAAGFEPDRRAVVVSTGVTLYLSKEANAATLRQIAQLAPGSTLATTFLLPSELFDDVLRPGLEVAEKGARAAGTPFISFYKPDEMMASALEAGFHEAQHASAPVLNERYFADRSPIGQQVRRGGPTSPPYTIVGVVGTINSVDLGEPVAKERLYYPVTQQPNPSMALIVKTRIDPRMLVSQVRSAVAGIDPEQPMADVRTMDEWMARSLEGRRAPMLLLALFGAVALTLSAIGIYGVLAFGVAQRSREFGIRQALGANPRAILRLVLTQGMRIAGIGIALGLAGSITLTRYLQSLLFDVGAHDVTVYAGVTTLLLAVALTACYLPARRATRVAPTVALRDS